jgi:hypothetical protein
MARGWESKSVEEQMAGVSQQTEEKTDKTYVSEEQRRLAEKKRAEKARKVQSLELQREHILSQRTSNVDRRAALASALAQIEAQLTELG